MHHDSRTLLKNFSQEQHLEFLFRLSSSLQTSLELDKQLPFYFDEMAKLINITGLDYYHPQYQLKIDIGQRGRHHCHYRLHLQGESLGEIGFSRNRRFGDKEQLLIESLLSLLVYPVRNALQYLRAIRSASIDTLTGVGNRQSFEQDIAREVLLNQRNDSRCSLLLVDLDGFKAINDTIGHQNGDIALQQMVHAIQSATRQSDRIYRYGGDEFLVLLDNTDEYLARLVAERIRMRAEDQVIMVGDREIPLSVSIGTATIMAQDTRNSLFDRADKALYEAKHKGRNCVVTARNPLQSVSA